MQAPLHKNTSPVIGTTPYVVLATNGSGTTLTNRQGDRAFGGPCEFLGGWMEEDSGTGTFTMTITDTDGKVLFTGAAITAAAHIPAVDGAGCMGPFLLVISAASSPFFTVTLFFRK